MKKMTFILLDFSWIKIGSSRVQMTGIYGRLGKWLRLTNYQSYTVSERNRMKQAMELAEKLGYPSVGTMMEFINSGTMNNLPVTALDAARAYAAYGSTIPSDTREDCSYS